MKLWLKCLIMVGILVIGGAAAVYWFRPEVRAEIAIAGMRIRDGNATVAGECPGDFSFNTFTDETHHQTIERIYESACRKMEAMKADRSLQTYAWADSMGWPGISTVLQLQNSYFIVTAFVGNDADSVTVRAEPGTYSAPIVSGPGPRVRTLNDWKLPDTFIKSEWSSR